MKPTITDALRVYGAERPMRQALTEEELDAWLVAKEIATSEDVRSHLSWVNAELAARQISTTAAMHEIRYANAALRRMARRATG